MEEGDEETAWIRVSKKIKAGKELLTKYGSSYRNKGSEIPGDYFPETVTLITKDQDSEYLMEGNVSSIEEDDNGFSSSDSHF